jgi:hypothetical protein
VFTASLDSLQPKPLEGIPPIAVFTKGYLLYVQENTLFARPFDANELKFVGEPVAIAQHVQSDAQFTMLSFPCPAPS